MASQTDVCNIACAILGVSPINAITDLSVQAVTFNSIWNAERQAELRKHTWKFSIARANLTALTNQPINGPYSAQFQMPAGWLRLLQAGDTQFDYPGADLSDYRSGPTQDDYVLEGGLILSNLGSYPLPGSTSNSPLSIRYQQDVTDWTLWDACFCDAMGARLAHRSCFRVTNSTALMKQAQGEYTISIRDAIRANAFESPPTYVADDTWVATRPVGSGGAPTIRYG